MAELQTDTANPTPEAEAPLLTITPKAVEMIKLTRQQEGIEESYGLRVAVMGGGCSGFQYALDFENEGRETDLLQQYEGLTVYIDPVSARYLDGVTIDYVLGMQGAGFKFINPRALGTCGCGSSFSV